MGTTAKSFSRLLTAAALSVTLVTPQLSFAQGAVEEDPSALAMVGDAIIARPLGLAFTIIGAATYVVTLPFALAGGNAKETGKVLVAGPAMATFVRCLGCTKSGYKRNTDIEPDAAVYDPQ
jgi:hypothetical protein